jgi:outer membrane protein TolC
MKGFLFAALIVSLLYIPPAVRPAGAEVYNLERCLEIALENSPAVGISRENLNAARSSVLQNYAYFLPNASVSFNAGHAFIGPSQAVAVDAQGRPITPAGFDYESYSFGLQGGLTLFDWGANFKRLSQSKHAAEASRYDLEYQKDFVTAVVIREYYDLVRQKKLREVQEEDVEASGRSLEQVEAFYNIGSRTKADFLQARVNLANSQLNLLNAQNAEAIAQARLLSRLNLPLNATLDIDESLAILERDVRLEDEVEYMLEHRSDLLGSRERVEAAKNGVTVAENGRYPDLSGFFSYGWNDRAFPEDANFFKNDYSWSVGVSLSYDIFNRFVDKTAIMNAKANKRIAEYNLQQAKLDAILDVKQIILNLTQARERLALSEETVTHAKENLRLAEERYRVGAGTILETIEASASLTAAQASLIEAKIDYLVNKADLQRATGRQISTR